MYNPMAILLNLIFSFSTCPGKGLAETITFLIIARMLATFTISRPLDVDGKEYLPEMTLSRYKSRYVLPFASIMISV